MIHNIAQSENCNTELRKIGFVEVLLPYLKSSSHSILLVTLATLADLVDDSEAKHLETNRDLFKFLLKCLTYALNDRRRRCEGWSVKELARSNYNLYLISGLFYSWEYGRGQNSYRESFPTISVKSHSSDLLPRYPSPVFANCAA